MRTQSTLATLASGAAVALVLAASLPAVAQDRDHEDGRGAARFVEMFDVDGDGRVSLAEIEGEQTRLFGAIDVDGDGVLSVDEFRRRGSLLTRLGTTTIFDLLDVNGDQHLAVDELNGPTARWLTRYDTNGDGALEAAELPSRGSRR